MTNPHIENPIPDAEWMCPNCKSMDEFYVDEVFDCGIPDCELPHSKDVVICYHCHGTWSLGTVIRRWAKKTIKVKCACCNGTGWVEEKGGTDADKTRE